LRFQNPRVQKESGKAIGVDVDAKNTNCPDR
jgi:hypothetical protein